MTNNSYVSIGFQCTVPTVLQAKQVKGQTLPFDWMLSSPKFIYEVVGLLLSGMSIEVLVREHFFNCTARAEILRGEDGQVILEHYITTESGESLLNQKYDVIFPHDKYDEETIQKYVRRFERLKHIILAGQDTTYVYISPSSEQSGEFWIDGRRVLENPIDYLNKIYTLLQQNSSTNIRFKACLTSISRIEELLPGIEHIAIGPKPVWLNIVDECVNKI